MSSSSSSQEIAANGALALIAVACSLLDRQIAALEKRLWMRAALQSGSTACARRLGAMVGAECGDSEKRIVYNSTHGEQLSVVGSQFPASDYRPPTSDN